MRLLIKWLVYSLVIVAAAYILPGISVTSFYVALIAGAVLGLINLIIRPIVKILTLPINFLTLGLFAFVINALLVLLTSYLVPGFRVANFWWALLLSFIISIVNFSLKHYNRGS